MACSVRRVVTQSWMDERPLPESSHECVGARPRSDQGARVPGRRERSVANALRASCSRGLAATFVSTTDDCWEELPTTPPSRILNGWILAIWGLLDLAAVTPSSRVQDVSTAALESLRRHLPEYDTGWWSTYDHPDGKPPRLASVTYHYEHIWMLRALAARTGVDDFAHWATRWDRDADIITHRLRGCPVVRRT
jgi:hypothetical protein